MSVSLVEVMAAASQRLAPLSGECAGHAVLAAVDQLLTSPRLVGPADVLIEENGAVRLGHGQAADARGCDEALRGLLDGLLTVAHSGGAGLMRVGRRAATGDLAQLVKELEVALIPANRAAARRSLARLHRETSRAREAGNLEHQPLPQLTVRRASALPSLSDASPPAGPALPPVSSAPPTGAPAPDVAASALPPVSAVPPAVAPEAVLPGASGEPLAITEIRWATAPRGTPAAASVAPTVAPVPIAAPEPAPASEVELTPELDVDVEITPVVELVRQTQPLPKVEPRHPLHQTAPLPPVSPQPRVPEHETPLEPVLSRRQAGLPVPRREFPDIHETPYLGTRVSAVPVYDEGVREAWQVPAPPAAGVDRPAVWGTDESTTDPAPAVAFGESDEDEELGAEPPLTPCPALAVEPRVVPLPPKEPRVFRPSEVEELVERFRIADPEPDAQLARSLKQLAGITATPPPVLARGEDPDRTPAPRTSPEPSGPDASSLRPEPTVPAVKV